MEGQVGRPEPASLWCAAGFTGMHASSVIILRATFECSLGPGKKG